jgi:hypothetical protein
MRFLVVILVFFGFISPASAQWLRTRKDRDRSRGKSPTKQPRRRAERPRDMPATAMVRTQPVVSELSEVGVRTRSQMHRDLDRVTSSIRSVFSPDKQHIAQVRAHGHGAAILLDGRRVYPRQGVSRLIGLPSFSPDSKMMAFLERVGREQRLVIVPDITDPDEVMTWRIPCEGESLSAELPGRAQPTVAPSRDRVFWADNRRVTVGEEILKPRAQVRLSFVTAGAE